MRQASSRSGNFILPVNIMIVDQVGGGGAGCDQSNGDDFSLTPPNKACPSKPSPPKKVRAAERKPK
jgi:hypothetical protein